MTGDEFKQIMRRLDEIGDAIIALSDGGSGASPIADDADLDGQYGNAEVKFDLKEKYWKGESFRGKRWSECSAEYLDATAEYLTVYARVLREKDNDEKKASYKDKDAARCRGWARRIRNGYKAPNARPQTAQGGFGASAANYGAPAYGQSASQGYGGQSGGYGVEPRGSNGTPQGGYVDQHAMPDHTGSFDGGAPDDDIPFASQPWLEPWVR